MRGSVLTLEVQRTLLAEFAAGGLLFSLASWGGFPRHQTVPAPVVAVPPVIQVAITPPVAASLETPSQNASEDNVRAAMKHWQSGIIYFQKGDYSKARDEWLLCKHFNPGNSDCQNGLQRIDQTYGGAP